MPGISVADAGLVRSFKETGKEKYGNCVFLVTVDLRCGGINLEKRVRHGIDYSEPVWLMTFDAPVYGARAYPMKLSRRNEVLIYKAEAGRAMDDAMPLK